MTTNTTRAHAIENKIAECERHIVKVSQRLENLDMTMYRSKARKKQLEARIENLKNSIALWKGLDKA